ncbi:MAG: lytic transglycosylase F, partial [Fulvivirga sp.]|nr:lytic transglycosylase F [Fulvivirga sp.]
GGSKYLKELYSKFDDIPDSVQRLKFTMASYNCGYYHVRDAQKLAETQNLDPTQWDDHVEEMILALSYPKNYNKEIIKYGYVRGIEPYEYVEQIFKRYDHYTQFIEKNA